jgi:tRNA pseudouridine65 synthase
VGESLPIEILHLDKDICVVNKPSGYTVHRTPGAENSPILLQTLRDQLDRKLYPIHRLDRGTSGCIAFAFSSECASKLQSSLQSETSTKKYQALCLGHLPKQGVINRDLSNEKKVKQSAITKYRVLKEFEKYSLLELEILTGRRHQIRRHLSFLGHHIIGDVEHGKGWLNRRFRDEFNFHRLFLHCSELSFEHPYGSQLVTVKYQLTSELEALLGVLD